MRGAATPIIVWLLHGIQAAGPNLTPKTFAQGLFALPTSGGAAQSRVDSSLIADTARARACRTTSTR